MPIFEYNCINCNNLEEHLIRNGESEPTECEKCKGELKKLISLPNFSLFGGGWSHDGYDRRKLGIGKHHKAASKEVYDDFMKEELKDD